MPRATDLQRRRRQRHRHAAADRTGRAFAKAKPQALGRVPQGTAEEKGLLGSEYYAACPLYPLAKTVAVINMDALDPNGLSRDFTTSGSAKLELLDELVAEPLRRNPTTQPDPKPEAGHFFRSDHFPFAKAGVPAISFGSGDDQVEGGVAAGKAKSSEAYTRDRYHQPADQWESTWTFAGMARDMQIPLHAVGNDLANSNRLA